MSMTPLDGLPMATRSGSLDPGVLLYLLREGLLTVDELKDSPYRRSGLLGLSGMSGDVRDLHASSELTAAFALEYFALRVAEEVGRMAVHVDGLDTLVFTGGIGANDPVIRGMVPHHLRHLRPFESLPIRSDEGAVMAWHAAAFLTEGRCRSRPVPIRRAVA